MAEASRWYVYLARCNDGSLYTGIAKDVKSRLAAHNAGKGAKYTRGRGPITLWAMRRCDSQGDALRLERAIKRLSRDEKERLRSPHRLRALAKLLLVVRSAEIVR